MTQRVVFICVLCGRVLLLSAEEAAGLMLSAAEAIVPMLRRAERNGVMVDVSDVNVLSSYGRDGGK